MSYLEFFSNICNSLSATLCVAAAPVLSRIVIDHCRYSNIMDTGNDNAVPKCAKLSSDLFGMNSIGKILGKTVAYTKYQKDIQLEFANIGSFLLIKRLAVRGDTALATYWQNVPESLLAKGDVQWNKESSKWSWEP